MNFMDIPAKELLNVGLIILGFILFCIIVNWLDRNVFNKNRYYNKRRKK